ncbi:transposase [Virgibacillus dokdonensis]|uniref:Transposase n=2 Tax=Virgibacillus dokdonensis TaxID=302167 RepID=A0A3E0WLR1_9BACI|nr:transposase [Virgibacillus dokdonensis]
MKVLQMSEIIEGLQQLIQQKEKEKVQILALRDQMNNFISLDDAFTGEGGESIKDHFTTLHLNTVILFNLFLETYLNALKELLSTVQAFEKNNGFIHSEFIEMDVRKSLNQLEDESNAIIEQINNEYSQISDLAGFGKVSPYLLNQQIAAARNQSKKTIKQLVNFDKQSIASLKVSVNTIDDVASFITKVCSWTSNGIFLTEQQIKEIEHFYSKSNIIQNMIDSATKLSIQQGDSTMQGEIASWIGNLNNTSKVYGVAKSTIAFQILNSNMLELTRDGNGNYIVTASSSWKNVNGKYNSKLAQNIHKILKYGDSKATNPIKRHLSKYNKAPSGVLKQLIGMKPATTRLSFGKIADGYSNVLVLDKTSLKDYRMKVDWKKTADQFSDLNQSRNLLRRVPYAGIVLSVGFNTTEYYKEENRNKSFGEKTGRFAAGLGVDAGIAGITTGGAMIGSMVCPGVGTIIGGVVGAGIGIIGSVTLEDKIKDVGEDAGTWIEDRAKDFGELKDNLQGGINKIGDQTSDFLSSIFN